MSGGDARWAIRNNKQPYITELMSLISWYAVEVLTPLLRGRWHDAESDSKSISCSSSRRSLAGFKFHERPSIFRYLD